MVGQILRFETKYAMLNDEIVSGRLGKAVSMHARRNRPKSLLPLYGRTHPALENCIHDVDLMLWYTGQPVRKVRGFFQACDWGKASRDLLGCYGIRRRRDRCGRDHLDASRCGRDAGRRISVYRYRRAWRTCNCTRAHWRSCGTTATISRTSLRSACWRSRARSVAGSTRLLLRVRAVDRAPQVITAIEAMRAVRVILALIESGESGRDVEIATWE